MSLTRYADRPADQIYQRIPGLFSGGGRARLIGPACPIALSRGNARQSDPRTFGAPHRAVSIPDANRRAIERLACGNDGGGEDEQCGHCVPLRGSSGSQNFVEGGSDFFPHRYASGISCDGQRADLFGYVDGCSGAVLAMNLESAGEDVLPVSEGHESTANTVRTTHQPSGIKVMKRSTAPSSCMRENFGLITPA